jgi:hypothetical protein
MQFKAYSNDEKLPLTNRTIIELPYSFANLQTIKHSALSCACAVRVKGSLKAQTQTFPALVFSKIHFVDNKAKIT